MTRMKHITPIAELNVKLQWESKVYVVIGMHKFLFKEL